MTSWKDCDCGFCKPERYMSRKAMLITLGVAIGTFMLGGAAVLVLILRGCP